MSKIFNVLSKILVGLVALFAVLFSSCSFFKFKTSCDFLNLPVYRDSDKDISLDSDYINGEVVGELKIINDDGWSKKYISIKVPQNLNDSVSYTLPSEQGKANYVLTWQEGNLLQWKDINSVSLGGTGELIQVVEKSDDTLENSKQNIVTTNTAQTGGSTSCTNLICTADRSNIALDSDVTGILSLENGGIGASLEDPGEDRILFWDESAGKVRWLKIGDNLDIDDRTLDAESSGGDEDDDSEVVVPPSTGYTGEIYSAGNGLYVSGSEVRLGGTLTENTKLSLGAYDMVYDLNGTGDFRIQDNENDVLFVANSGNIGIGTTNPLYKLDIYQEGLMDVEIGVLNYYGSGLDDMSSVGTFTGSEETVYAVRIDSEGTPDTFAWTDDAWETNTTGVPITGGTQPLNNGVIVSFSNTTGHTAYDDYWAFTVNIQKNPAANLFGIRDWKGDYAFHVDSNGNIGIGTTSSEERLTLAGGNFYHYAEGNPILAGSYSAVSGIYVVGDYVYATGAEGFEIIDVTDPSKPSLAGSYPGVYGEVIVSGNYAYVLGGSSLNILDISNIASPTLLGTYNEGGRDFYLSGKYAYISRYSDYMSIVDISNPASPLLAGTYNYPAYHHGEAIGGNGKYIYLNLHLHQYNSWIQVIDVSNPVNPSDVGLYILPKSRIIVDIDISGNYAYVATNYGNTYILDISNPQSPQNISYISAYGRYGQGIYVSGNYAYRAAILQENGGGILSVVNISNPLEPVQVGYYLAYQDFGPSVRGVFVSGKYAYLEGDDSLFILDINGIETPTLNAGNIKVGDLFVTDNINIGKDLSIRNSLNIGTGGLYSQGAASIMLGAGITSPQTALSVYQLSSGDILNLFNSTGEVLTLTSDGYLGIGTTNPLYKLDISSSTTDTIARFSSSDDLAQILLSDNDTTGYLNVKDSIFSIGLTSGLSNNNLNINSSGNIGIGTTTPGLYKLYVAGSFIASNYFSSDGTLGATATINGLVFKDGLYTSGTFTDQNTTYTASNGLTLSGTEIQLGGTLLKSTSIIQGNYNMIYNLTGTGSFDIQDSGVSSLYVSGSNGNVGIGTTNPGEQLDVVGGNIRTDSSLIAGGAVLGYGEGTGVTDRLGGSAKFMTGTGYIYFDRNNSDVTMDETTGDLSGHAYSDDLGWLDFGEDENPSGPVNVNLTSGSVTGKAYVISSGSYVDFTNYSSNVSVDLDTGIFTGYAWSEQFGWVDFSDSGVYFSNNSITTYAADQNLFINPEGDGVTFISGNVTIDGSTYSNAFSGNSSLRLQTAGIDRIYVDETLGYVGVGTTAPTSKLEIVGSGSSSSTSSLWIKNASEVTSLYVNDLGNVGIGTTNPGEQLDVVGGNIRTDSNLIAGGAVLGYGEGTGVTDRLGGSAKFMTGTGYIYFDRNNSDVTMDETTGDLSGHAYSDDLGWIDFGEDENPSGPVNVNLTSGSVTGKAYVLTSGSYVDFTNYSSNVSVNLSTGVFTGYVWAEEAGWVDFSDSGVYFSNNTITTFAADQNLYINPEGDGVTFMSGNVTIDGTVFANAFSSNSPLRLQTAGIDRIYVDDTNGYVGIGTTDPSSMLEIIGVGTGSDTSSLWIKNASGTTGLFVNDLGSVGIGTTAPDNWGTGTTVLTIDGISQAGIELQRGGEEFGWLWSGSYPTGGDYLSLQTSDDQTLYLGTFGAGKIDFLTNNIERMSIDANGNVGIGTTSPSSMFSIAGAGYGTFGPNYSAMMDILQPDAEPYSLVLRNETWGLENGFGQWVTDDGQLKFDGWVGSGTNPTILTLNASDGRVRFDSYGAGTLITDSIGNITASSDERLKDIQGSFDRGLEEILQLDPILYKWNDVSGMETETVYAGLSAQNVQSVIPEAVGVSSDGYLTLSDRPILSATINAIKEQQLQIEELRDLLIGEGKILESTEFSESIPTTDAGILAEIQTLYQEFKDMILTLGMTSHTDADGTNYLSIDSDVKMAGDLSVLGETTTSNLTVTGNIQMGLITVNTEENSIDVLGVSCYNEETGEESEFCTDTINDPSLSTLYLQKSSSGNLNIFNGKLVIEPNGTLKLDGNLEVSGSVNSKSIDTETVNTEKIILKNSSVEESETPSGEDILEPQAEEFLDLTEPCEKGEIKWDDNNIYVCTSSEKWRVSPLNDIE